MRLNQYIIFLIIFTICYFSFFILIDKISTKSFEKKIIKNAFNLINLNTYKLFAAFYGITGAADLQKLQAIYLNYRNSSTISIKDECKLYGLNDYEFCVVILYLEYLNLFPKKLINYTSSMITSVSFKDASLVDKYNLYFNQKYDYNTICSMGGYSSTADLAYLNNYFLIPGIRLINSVLYYVGDLNEKK